MLSTMDQAAAGTAGLSDKRNTRTLCTLRSISCHVSCVSPVQLWFLSAYQSVCNQDTSDRGPGVTSGHAITG